ncbi:MAG: hypothetical protein QI199_04835 [Candidatus Korarchaeota archaeon]|nr:hypothetical protein [Candidatus Korarchaeota archaeon]
MKPVRPEFLDIINYAICSAVNEFLGPEKAREFFRRVGEHHLEEAMRRGLISLEGRKPLDALLGIARYLEDMGYMGRIEIERLSDTEAIVTMRDVSVTESSLRLLGEGKEPSHYMTNLMFAALRRLGIEAELRDLEARPEENTFREHWIIKQG